MAEYVNPRAQACQNCVKAKAKCYNQADGKCERCNRLSKDCVMQAPVVRKRKAEKTSREAQARRIAELELKLEDLASHVLPSRPSPLSVDNADFVVIPNPISTSTPSVDSSSTPHVPSNQQSSTSWQTTPSGSSTIRNPQPLTDSLSDGPDSTFNISSGETAGIPVDPDELLNIFRCDLARQVPFISLSDQATAITLSKEKPFLYQAIITVTSYHDSVHQFLLGQEFIRNFTEHLVIRGQKNLDMLQGLLVYISWYNGLLLARTQITTLLSMAFCLLVDLHLYLPMANFETHDKFMYEMKGIISAYHVTWTRKAEPTRDERRTILGCFYVFSTVSAIFCRINPLRWTPYLQNCYNDMLTHPENKGDIYLAYLSSLQRISENIRQSRVQEYSSQLRNWDAATGVHVKLLKAELETFQASLPEDLQQDPLILVHYHSIEINLYDVCFSMPPTVSADMPSLQRADVLLMCYKATRAVSDVWLSISLDSMAWFNFRSVFMAPMYFVLMNLSKLAIFCADDWDLNNVQPGMDLFTLLERFIEITECASARYDLREDEKPWLNVSQRTRQLKVKFEHLLANENWSSASTVPVEQEGGSVANAAMPIFLSQFDWMDNEFWQNLPDENAFMQ